MPHFRVGGGESPLDDQPTRHAVCSGFGPASAAACSGCRVASVRRIAYASLEVVDAAQTSAIDNIVNPDALKIAFT